MFKGKGELELTMMGSKGQGKNLCWRIIDVNGGCLKAKGEVMEQEGGRNDRWLKGKAV